MRRHEGRDRGQASIRGGTQMILWRRARGQKCPRCGHRLDQHKGTSLARRNPDNPKRFVLLPDQTRCGVQGCECRHKWTRADVKGLMEAITRKG